MFQSEALQEKWAPLLEHEGLDSISDSHKKSKMLSHSPDHSWLRIQPTALVLMDSKAAELLVKPQVSTPF
jgi:hypothetical protein